MPLAIRASIERCNKQRSPIFNKHLGVFAVSGRRREAMPAARINAFIRFKNYLECCNATRLMVSQTT